MILKPRAPRAFVPLLKRSRYKGAYGGRGSGKSHFFAELLIARCVSAKTDAVCIREVQKDLKKSAKKLIEGKIEALGVSHLFDIQTNEIRGPHGGVIIFQGMQDHTAESIKSLEDFDIAWVEEAQSLSAFSLGLLRPTIRKPGSELWFSWNPRRKKDPVDALLRGPTHPTGSIVVEANWRDNPWFPPELETERQDDLRDRPDGYEHTWDGGYVKVVDGAYFAKELATAKADKRIAFVPRDPNLQVRTFWDLGRRDHTAIWVAQWVGQKINVIDHIEGSGQAPSHYFEELRTRGYRGCMVYLPHDGSRVGPDNSTGRSYEDQARDAGFDVEVILNQGQGAAMLRVDAARRLFPRIWFDETKTEGGRQALGAYHERKDEKRDIGLGPEHDWASHSADAFGLLCVAYEEPRQASEAKRPKRVSSETGWMGQ